MVTVVEDMSMLREVEMESAVRDSLALCECSRVSVSEIEGLGASKDKVREIELAGVHEDENVSARVNVAENEPEADSVGLRDLDWEMDGDMVNDRPLVSVVVLELSISVKVFV